jgi:hypothetical protein
VAPVTTTDVDSPTTPAEPEAAASAGPTPSSESESAAEPASPTVGPMVVIPAPSTTPSTRSTADPKRVTDFATASRVLDRNELRTAKASFTTSAPWRGAIRLLGAAGKNGAPPILLLLVAFAFLAAQDRIDRNDPKLALAPVHGHQELTFKPIDRGTS